LDFIAGCLNVRPAARVTTEIRASASTGSLDWVAVAEIATSEMVTPALWNALQRSGIAALVPDHVAEQLRGAYLVTVLQNARFKEQALAITRALNAHGIRPTFLKGGASLFHTPYDDQGCRAMADLDILVPEDRAEESQKTIMALGYAPIDIEFDHSQHHHLRPLWRETSPGTVEVHRALLAPPATSLVRGDFIHQHLVPLSTSGAQLLVPDATLRIVHILFHSGIVDRNYARRSSWLRDVHELAATQSAFGTEVDWPAIGQVMGDAGSAELLEAWTYLAHRMFGSPLPDVVKPTRRAVMYERLTRMQVALPALDRLIGIAMLFSQQSLRDRYGCQDDAVTLASARARRAASLAWHASKNLLQRPLRRSQRR
jgi:hypothetical protein